MQFSEAESGAMVPFSEHPEVLALAPKLREAEDAVCRGQAGARGTLADRVDEQKKLVTRLREERCARRQRHGGYRLSQFKTAGRDSNHPPRFDQRQPALSFP